jgi:hypothetical protein
MLGHPETNIKEVGAIPNNFFMEKIKHLLFLFAFVLFIASCKKDGKQSAKLNEQLKAEDFAYIGKAHNQQLSVVYNALLKSKNSSGFRTNSRESFTEIQALDIAEETIVDEINHNNSLPSTIKAISIGYVTNTFSGVPVMENNKLYTIALASSLPQSVISILDRIDILLVDADSSLGSLNAGLNAIEGEVPSLNLSLQHQGIVYSATNIARYTAQYWVENLNAWLELAQGNIGGRNSRSFWGWLKSVGGGDVAGGVGAAAGAWAANVIIGAGTVAYGGAIVTGAVGGSVYNAISYFF